MEAASRVVVAPAPRASLSAKDASSTAALRALLGVKTNTGGGPSTIAGGGGSLATNTGGGPSTNTGGEPGSEERAATDNSANAALRALLGVTTNTGGGASTNTGGEPGTAASTASTEAQPGLRVKSLNKRKPSVGVKRALCAKVIRL